MKKLVSFEEYRESLKQNESNEEVNEKIDMHAIHRKSKDKKDFAKNAMSDFTKKAPSLAADEDFMNQLEKSFQKTEEESD